MKLVSILIFFLNEIIDFRFWGEKGDKSNIREYIYRLFIVLHVILNEQMADYANGYQTNFPC